MILHLIPVNGLSDEYINWLRLLGSHQDNVFCITSSRSAVIKYTPQLLGLRNAVILPEPGAKDKKKKIFFKTVSEMSKKAHIIIWHGMLSTNKRFAAKFMKKSAVAEKSVMICDGEEYQFLKSKYTDFLKLFDRFKRICFINPIMQREFTNCEADIGLDTKKIFTMDLVPHRTFFKGICSENGEFIFDHTNINMCIVPDLQLSMEERQEYLESLFDIKRYEEGHDPFIEQVCFEDTEVYCFIYKHKSNNKYKMLPYMDCVYFSDFRSWNMRFVLYALSLGKHVFINGDFYTDYFRSKGLTVFDASQFQSADKSSFTKPLTENINCPWLKECMENDNIIAQWTDLINALKKDVTGV